jgi:uncharacterized protein (TIGR00290 family)
MNGKIPVIMAWSGGKDSAYALFQLMKDGRYEVTTLISTINGNNNRLSMHGVREELMEQQAAEIGIPLIKVYVYEGNNEEYEDRMSRALVNIKGTGVETVAFGDIFLEDLRAYRENQMRKIGMNCLFPLWKTSTPDLAHNFIAEGFKTITCCVHDGFLDQSWCGRLIDEEFIKALPPGVDPCGENGEFHSFCFEGPIFKRGLSIVAGEKMYKPLDQKTGFWFCDLNACNVSSPNEISK